MSSPPPPPVVVELGGLSWRVEPSLAESLRPLLERAARGELAGEVVKENPKRRVVRATTEVGEVFQKSYFVTSSLERVKHAFVASKARSEHDAMRRLRAAGVATAEPLASGERRRAGVFLEASTFLARAVPSARPFARELDARRAKGDEAPRRALIEDLAQLAAAIARAGADHRDLHVGNVLLDDQGRATIVDLHAVGFPRTLSRARRLERLARLALSLGPDHEDRAVAAWAREETRWLAQTAARLDPDLGEARELEAFLLARAEALLGRHLRSRDRRCLVDSKGFAVEGPRSRRVYRLRDFPAADVEAALAAPAESLLHRHARGRSVLEVIGLPGRQHEAENAARLVRKREDLGRLTSRLGALFTGTRARRAWLAARALGVRGLPAPRALALVEERTLGLLPRRSWLLMEHLPRTTMVHVYLQETLKDGRAPGSAPWPYRRRLARELGRLVARLHARGLVHRDLAVQNLLLRERPTTFDLWFVDLDEVRVRAPRPSDVRRALVQLADLPREASRTDKLRGFRAYLEEGGVPALRALVEREGERRVLALVANALEARAVDKARRAARRAGERNAKEDSLGSDRALAPAAGVPQDEGARPRAEAPDRQERAL